jgi:streptogramin lyase
MKHAIVVLAIVGALLAVPGEAGATGLEFGLQFGSTGSGNGQFKGDYGVAIDPSGNVWVADSGTSNIGNNRIQVFSGTGAYITQYGSYGNTSTAAGYFNRPKGVAVNLNSGASLGDVWVSDTGNNRIQMYDVSTGLWAKYVSSFALGSPQGLDVDTSGNVWVADFNNNRIQKFNGSTWTTIYGTNTPNTPPNSFLFPSDVAVDPSGVVWVADTGHSTIQKGVLSGSIWSWTQYGSGYLSSPRGLDLDPLGNVWVTDSGNNQIAMYDVTANTWTSYGASGTGSGQFNFPTGIAVDALGNMWVADTGNNRIQSTVPEPVTMAGLALGLSCLTNYIRRRRTA